MIPVHFPVQTDSGTGRSSGEWLALVVVVGHVVLGLKVEKQIVHAVQALELGHAWLDLVEFDET